MDQQLIDVDNTIEQLRIYLPNLIEACEFVSDLIIQPLSEKTWENFGIIVDSMDDLYRTLNDLNESMEQAAAFYAIQPNIVRTITGLSDHFGQMNACMDKENYRDASDSLRYELTPLFRQLAADLGEQRSVLEERYKKNLDFLKSTQPKLYEQVSSFTRERNQCQIMYSKNGQPNLCLITDETNPLYLYSQYDPSQEVRYWREQLELESDNHSDTFFYGFGLGYHVESYAEMYPEHRLSIYEPDVQVLLASMEVIDLSEVFQRLNIIDFVIGTDKEQRDRMFYRFLKQMKGEPELLALPIYDKVKGLNKEQFSKDAATAIMNYKSAVSMNDKYGVQWVENSMYNLAKVLKTPSILGLRNKLEGKKAVIVGAGPSLEADIKSLRRLKNHAFIIAAGSTIQSLLHYGIVPHLIVSIDGAEANYKVFKDLDIKGIPMLYAPMIQYRIIDSKSDHLFHVRLNNDATLNQLMDVTNEEPVFQSNLSVTGTAIQAAIYMGCKEIIFTGQDLSYPGELMYASGAKHVDRQQNDLTIQGAERLVENVRGTMNRTTDAMMLTLADIEELLENNSDIHFINTTQMGAVIKHTVSQSMEEILRHLEDNSRLDEDFFLKEMDHLKPYDAERINKIESIIMQLPEEMLLIEERLTRVNLKISKLSELSRVNPRKCADFFTAIDAEWKLIINSWPFKAIYITVCRNAVIEFERNFSEFVKQTNLIKKAALAVEVMQPLVRQMLEKSTELKLIVNETKRRVEERSL
ncbi:6-hydroxymethylpterin diphosphokinase MptE-like protein [Paenibacillus gorillae]|uniref:motility associated factor glycosyltransferase family protein n=1 Tax=Paenibacillus gorillae TaxID=1243662 RepID=UPI0004BCF914|nr:6-hydroxymethylpterin diphosphokinase MptE-like protein [Paenibacillus gorillae]